MKTIVLGASTNEERYACKAVRKLAEAGHEVVPVGRSPGRIGETEILTGQPAVDGVDTVTLYVGPQHQNDIADYVIGLEPRRVIFNPGTENPGFEARLRDKGIEVTEACTLVLLASGQY